MAATETKTKTPAKRQAAKRSTAAVAEGKRRTAAAKNRAAAKAKAQDEQKALIAKARKDPKALTVEERREIASAAVPGLKGKARKLWIEEAETPEETVKRAPASKAKAAPKEPQLIEPSGRVHERAAGTLALISKAKAPVPMATIREEIGGEASQFLPMLAMLEAAGLARKYRIEGGQVAYMKA